MEAQNNSKTREKDQVVESIRVVQRDQVVESIKVVQRDQRDLMRFTGLLIAEGSNADKAELHVADQARVLVSNVEYLNARVDEFYISWLSHCFYWAVIHSISCIEAQYNSETREKDQVVESIRVVQMDQLDVMRFTGLLIAEGSNADKAELHVADQARVLVSNVEYLNARVDEFYISWLSHCFYRAVIHSISYMEAQYNSETREKDQVVESIRVVQRDQLDVMRFAGLLIAEDSNADKAELHVADQARVLVSNMEYLNARVDELYRSWLSHCSHRPVIYIYISHILFPPVLLL